MISMKITFSILNFKVFYLIFITTVLVHYVKWIVNEYTDQLQLNVNEN